MDVSHTRSTLHAMPRPHRCWGACADELLYHTSRYYAYTEAFLRNLVGGRQDFSMGGYQARRLSESQRRLMLAMLIDPPDVATGRDVMSLVEQVSRGSAWIDPGLRQRYHEQLKRLLHTVVGHAGTNWLGHDLPASLPALDPFLAMAERLDLPVRVMGWHVDVPFELLMRHMDCPMHQVRENLQQSILWLHEAGYHLRNRPGLTHAQCRIRRVVP